MYDRTMIRISDNKIEFKEIKPSKEDIELRDIINSYSLKATPSGGCAGTAQIRVE